APSLHRNPLGKSTVGGAQTGELDPAAEPALAALLKLLDREFSGLLRDLEAAGLGADHPALSPRRRHRTLRLWGTVLPEGGRQVPHIHPLAWYSGVYYAELPPGVAGTAGALEFFRPPDRWTVSRPPAPMRIEARPGRLVLFPSWYFHSTALFEGAG